MKRMGRSYNKSKKTICLLIIAFVAVFMSVGYSLLNQRLQIIGTTNLYASEKYLWHKILNDYGVGTSNGLVANEYEANKYSYVGSINATHNYITFNNELWRILSIESDNTIKIIRIENPINMEYDQINNRTATSTYCTDLTNGCNAWATKSVLTNDTITGNVENNSSINTYLNTTFYNSLSSEAKDNIVEHVFNVGAVSDGSNYVTALSEEIEQTWTGKVGLLTISEIMFSTNETPSIVLGDTNSVFTSSYITSDSNKIIWTMSMLKNSSSKIWTQGPYSNNFDSKSVNLLNETDQTTTIDYIAYPVVHLSNYVEYNSGNGTVANPFTIK